MIKINDFIIEQNHFADGALKINLALVNYFSNPVIITWLYENDGELFTLKCIVDYLRDRESCFNFKYALHLPYIPHARMDRIKEVGDVFTLKSFCDIINSMDFLYVEVTDPHSDVAPALLNRCHLSYLKTHLFAVKNAADNPIILFPDHGSAKRYSSDPYVAAFAFCGEQHLAPESTYAIKSRDWKTGRITSLTLAEPEKVKDRNVVIIDDICSYGGTFAQAAQALKAAGAKDIYLAVTHCEKNIFKGKVFSDGNITAVYTTNSLLRAEDVPAELKDKVFISEVF